MSKPSMAFCFTTVKYAGKVEGKLWRKSDLQTKIEVFMDMKSSPVKEMSDYGSVNLCF
uniref:Uncharacterized protein n=1 Tax=Arion vulgaris TaxID=1028688 RepID=A0A0B7BJD7_9EUPU